MSPFKSGSVALIGKPNVGKSTLTNRLVGHKVSIVSDKPQTTRRRALGVLTTDEYQIAFFDTPGIHAPHTQLGKMLNESARSVEGEVDLNLVVVDASRKPNREDESIAQFVLGGANKSLPRLLCLNKMDLLKPADVVEHVEVYAQLFETEAYMLTSLTKDQNVDKLFAMIVERLPEGELLYPPDEYTDQPMRFLAAEIIREKALRKTRQEVPHAIATMIDDWEEEEELTRISASIIVEKDGQKAIIIGKQGSMLREIGTESRLELEEMIERRVFLNLVVKVREGWRQNPRMLRDLDYTA